MWRALRQRPFSSLSREKSITSNLDLSDNDFSSSTLQECPKDFAIRKSSLCSVGSFDGYDQASTRSTTGSEFKNNNNKTYSYPESDLCDDCRDESTLDDMLVTCCYDEDCCNQRHEVLAEKLKNQVAPLVESFYCNTSILLIGLASVLAMAVKDILRLSEDEPYGIRGASIIVKLRKGSSAIRKTAIDSYSDERTLGVITMDENTVSTFELTLVLYEEPRLGTALKNWLLATFARSARQTHVIKQNYEISKKKLYR